MRIQHFSYDPFLRSDDIGNANRMSDPIFRRRFKDQQSCEVEDDMSNPQVASIVRVYFLPDPILP
jgi:hypothetical protein